ncbi:MAG: hypothetical protein JSS30_07555 [Verrucomicrobia bacterium]|nr:hypothetical protein [Verrucomicrobiota bacterium]
MSDALNNFNLMGPVRIMGGIVALQGAYDLCASVWKTNPAQKKMLQNQGFENFIGGSIVLFAATKASLTISQIPQSIQHIVARNVKLLLSVGSFAMLAYGIEQVYQSLKESDERKSHELSKSGIGHAAFGTAGLIALKQLRHI